MELNKIKESVKKVNKINYNSLNLENLDEAIVYNEKRRIRSMLEAVIGVAGLGIGFLLGTLILGMMPLWIGIFIVFFSATITALALGETFEMTRDIVNVMDKLPKFNRRTFKAAKTLQSLNEAAKSRAKDFGLNYDEIKEELFNKNKSTYKYYSNNLNEKEIIDKCRWETYHYLDNKSLELKKAAEAKTENKTPKATKKQNKRSEKMAKVNKIIEKRKAEEKELTL